MPPKENEKPDFFLWSADSVGFGEPRACKEIGRFVSAGGTVFMHVRFTPPLGSDFLEPGKVKDEALLAPHYEKDTIYPISRWPLLVYVFYAPERRVGDPLERVKHGISMAFWGELYPTREDAEAVRRLMADSE